MPGLGSYLYVAANRKNRRKTAEKSINEAWKGKYTGRKPREGDELNNPRRSL